MNGPEKLPQWQADRLATLLDALDGAPISDVERGSLTWLWGSRRTPWRTSPG